MSPERRIRSLMPLLISYRDRSVVVVVVVVVVVIGFAHFMAGREFLNLCFLCHLQENALEEYEGLLKASKEKKRELETIIIRLQEQVSKWPQ